MFEFKNMFNQLLNQNTMILTMLTTIINNTKMDTVRIAVWNSNGLNKHIGEIPIFLKANKIDILLISESHTTEQSVIKIPYYTTYYANHPDGTDHAGSALITKSQLKHYCGRTLYNE
jgi:exonuclease III